jgi:hypothetical protein
MAAEVLGIISAAAALGKTLMELSSAINSFVGVGKEIRAIKAEVETLQRVNTDFEAALRSNRALPSQEWLNTANDVVFGCDTTTKEINAYIASDAGAGPKGSKLTFRKRVTWSIKRGDVERYCILLRSYSDMLGRLQMNLIQWVPTSPFGNRFTYIS